MSFLRTLLGLEGTAAAEAGSSETVRRIAARLSELPAERARYLAAFAFVLARVAHADLEVSPTESRKMEELVAEVGELPGDQAVLVVEIAKTQNRLFGGTENFLVTREFRDIASDAERQRLLHCLFAVAAADRSISGAEEAQIRQIASELGFSHGEFVQARLAWSEHRDVLKGL